MKANLVVNCGKALLLSDKENVLQQYESIVINCGHIAIGDELNAAIAGKNVVFNCGHTAVVKTPKNPVRADGRVTIDRDSDFSGQYLIAGDIIVTPEGAEKISSMEGLLAQGTLYYPQSVKQSVFAGVSADRLAAYPDGAVLVFEDIWLGSGNVSRWQENTTYYIAHKLFAVDTEVLESLKSRGVAFACNKLIIPESAYAKYSALFAQSNLQLTPDGYQISAKAMPLMDLYATYGEKVCLLEDITIPAKDHKHLSLFDSIIVKGKVTVCMDHLAQVKKVLSADSLKVYEGELMAIESFQILGHEALRAAREAGTRYTITVNGALLLGDDVTLDDVQAICALRVNGMVSAPSVTHPYLSGVAGKINGALLGSIPEIMKMIETVPEEARNSLGGMIPGPFRSMLGLENDEGSGSVINCGKYVLI